MIIVSGPKTRLFSEMSPKSSTSFGFELRKPSRGSMYVQNSISSTRERSTPVALRGVRTERHHDVPGGGGGRLIVQLPCVLSRRLPRCSGKSDSQSIVSGWSRPVPSVRTYGSIWSIVNWIGERVTVENGAVCQARLEA